jgi:hypothetical protein
MSQEPMQVSRIEEDKARFYANYKSGVSWFFWLAVISLVNIIIRITNPESQIRFAVGLSITNWLEHNPLPFLTVLSPKKLAFGVGIVFIVLLVLLGLMARKRNKPAYLTGMIIYALDIIPAFLIKDVYSIVFHLIVLGFLIWGFVHLLKLEKLEAEYPDETEPEVIVIGPDKP